MEESNLKNYEIRSSTTLYSIHKLIGKGRFSRVYQATDTFTNNTVVIKKLINLNIKRKSDRFLYLKELDLLKKLKVSPFRSRYVELRDLIVLSSGGICFVMERLGTTLQAVIHNKGRLPLSMCRLIIRQLAQALVGLKCMGIVHADLKPDNIMFCEGNGNNHLIKIIDFGWAFNIMNLHTMECSKFQAIPYRAPEVCFQKSLDYGLDLWSLGCIMPEIVTGVKLFDVIDEEHLIKLIIRMLSVPDVLTPKFNDLINSNETKPSCGWLQFLNLNTTTVDTNKFQNQEDILWFTDLVYKLLSIKSNERITAIEALAHPFLTMIHFIKYPITNVTKENEQLMKKSLLDINYKI